MIMGPNDPQRFTKGRPSAASVAHSPIADHALPVQGGATPATGHDGMLLEEVVRHIHDHADEPLKVCDLARTFGVSRRWLSLLFATQLGRTPHEEIVRARFAHIERLLLETDLTLADVATRSGFRHGEYMTVAFTRRYGMPPSQWRRQRRQSFAAGAGRQIG